jgi:hypothetical protein
MSTDRGVDHTLALTLVPKVIAAPLGLATLLIAGLAARGGWGWAGGLFVVVALGYGLVLERRLDFGHDGLTLTPMLPLRPRQRFLWQNLETPRFAAGYAGFGKVKVPLSAGRYFLAGVFPRRSIDLTAIYTTEGGRRGALHPAELAALIQQFRIAAGTEPGFSTTHA